jgi:short-subunit dehydrogenase
MKPGLRLAFACSVQMRGVCRRTRNVNNAIPMNPLGSVALITGAGSGLGRELARQLARDGVAIAALDRAADGLATLEQELTRAGQRIAWAVADVTDAAAVREQAAKLEQQLGPIDLLIASAGVGIETSAFALNADDVAKVIEVNLIGVANSIAAVLPGMIERRRGHISAISSLASLRGVPRMLAYCASKSGVNALLEGLRAEVHSHGITVTTICPGWIRTPMTAQIKKPMPGLMEVEDAARRIINGLRRRTPFLAFPRAVAWRLRLLRWLPSSWSDWLIRRMTGKVRT